jgi:hypothetical protein
VGSRNEGASGNSPTATWQYYNKERGKKIKEQRLAEKSVAQKAEEAGVPLTQVKPKKEQR